MLNVNSGGHWVLATSLSGSTITVNDPGYTRTTYTVAEVSQCGVYVY